MQLVKSPLLLKWCYPTRIWNKSRTEKIVYLTFDDGPVPNVTEFVLNTLKSFELKATFFCIGDNIRKHPSIFERIKNEQHSIGNHTYNHLNGWQTDTHSYVQNFLKCVEISESSLFRPPYGKATRRQIRQIQACMPHKSLQVVMWDVLSRDFDQKCSPENCYQNVIQHTKNGSIIVFHDSIKAFDRLRYALPRSIEYLLEAGYRFGTL